MISPVDEPGQNYQTLGSTANVGRADGEHATTAPLLDSSLEIAFESIQGTGTSPTSAMHLDHPSGLLLF
jgi:hypothetical protein